MIFSHPVLCAWEISGPRNRLAVKMAGIHGWTSVCSCVRESDLLQIPASFGPAVIRRLTSSGPYCRWFAIECKNLQTCHRLLVQSTRYKSICVGCCRSYSTCGLSKYGIYGCHSQLAYSRPDVCRGRSLKCVYLTCLIRLIQHHTFIASGTYDRREIVWDLWNEHRHHDFAGENARPRLFWSEDNLVSEIRVAVTTTFSQHQFKNICVTSWVWDRAEINTGCRI